MSDTGNELRERASDRRMRMRTTIEAVLTETLTGELRPDLKAAQVTLAIEGQIIEIIEATRTAALGEVAAIAERRRDEYKDAYKADVIAYAAILDAIYKVPATEE